MTTSDSYFILVRKIFSLKQCIALHKNSGGAAAKTGEAWAP